MTDLVDTEVISVEQVFRERPEHFKWIADLNATWKLARNGFGPDEVKWNAVPVKRGPKDTDGPFYFRNVRPDEAPELANRVFCVQDGEAVSGWFGAPILYSPARGKLSELGDYQIRKVGDKEIESDLFLAEVLSDLEFPEHTPVHKAVFFLPIPPKGETYETHFFPMVSTRDATAHYLVVEQTLVPQGQVSDSFAGRQLMIVSEGGIEKYLKATFTPDNTEEGRIIIPRYEGRVLVLSKPVKIQRTVAQGYRGYDFRSTTYFDQKSQTRGVEVDTVSLGPGMTSRNRSALVEATEDYKRLPSVFDIRCIGVRRDAAERYDGPTVKRMFKAAYGVVKI